MRKEQKVKISTYKVIKLEREHQNDTKIFEGRTKRGTIN